MNNSLYNPLAWSVFVAGTTPRNAVYVCSRRVVTAADAAFRDAEQRAFETARRADWKQHRDAMLAAASRPVYNYSTKACPGCGRVADVVVAEERCEVTGDLIDVACSNCGWTVPSLEEWTRFLVPLFACRSCGERINDGRTVADWDNQYHGPCGRALGLTINLR